MSRITDASKSYLLVCRCDGYTTKQVFGHELVDAKIALEYGSVDDCDAESREIITKHLLDEDNWILDNQYGPVQYHEGFEDGQIEILLIVE